MRFLAVLFLIHLSSFCVAQEVEQDSIIQYVFENEFVYGEVKLDPLENENELLTVHFTSDKFLKMSFPVNGVMEYILIDNLREFGAMRNQDSIDIKDYSDMPKKAEGSMGIQLVKTGEASYGEYECDIYEAAVGTGTLELYFEKKESITFNSFITKFLLTRGIAVDENAIPKGKIVLIKDDKVNEGGFALELKEYTENIQIEFTLKTGE